MPTCGPRCVEPLCFLVQRNSTVRSPVNLERRCSLSKKIIKCLAFASPPCLHVFSFFFFSSFPSKNSFPFYSFSPFFFFLFALLFFFSFLFSFPFIFSLFPPFSFHFLFLFGALTVWVKRRKFPPPFLKPNLCGFPFSYLYSLFLYFFYDIIPYMA